jgi:hypothetical protein
MRVVTVQDGLNPFERDQPFLNHFINDRQERGYLFLTINRGWLSGR